MDGKDLEGIDCSTRKMYVRNIADIPKLGEMLKNIDSLIKGGERPWHL